MSSLSGRSWANSLTNAASASRATSSSVASRWLRRRLSANVPETRKVSFRTMAPETRFHDLGSDFYDTRIGPERKKHNYVRQLEALGYKVTLEPAA